MKRPALRPTPRVIAELVGKLRAVLKDGDRSLVTAARVAIPALYDAIKPTSSGSGRKPRPSASRL